MKPPVWVIFLPAIILTILPYYGVFEPCSDSMTIKGEDRHGALSAEVPEVRDAEPALYSK